MQQHKLSQPRVKHRKVKQPSTTLMPLHNVEIPVISVDIIRATSQQATVAAFTIAGVVTDVTCKVSVG